MHSAAEYPPTMLPKLLMNSEPIAFVLASAALLGSPGPGIAALIVAGRTLGSMGALPFFLTMQAGLALAAALSAMGLATVLNVIPGLRFALTLASAAYLLWLAWSVATSPLRESSSGDERGRGLTLAGGFTLGAANPKAYLAFASLFGSFAIVDPAYGWRDSALKAVLCITVAAVVDFAWVLFGVVLRRLRLSATAERAMNVSLGGAILLAFGMTLI
jgi:threonine/homoserine/homoserine lactone efflux protein